MKYKWMVVFLLLAVGKTEAQQTLWNKLQTAWDAFNNDPQLKYALAGICVLDAQTGKPLFEKNSNIGMVPASTQKVITSIAAFEALGKSYCYKTKFGYTGSIENRKLIGDLVIEGSGDPTLGSERYNATKNNYDDIVRFLNTLPFDSITGVIADVSKAFDINPIPDNWIWGDIGNYYGAGHWAINWNENQNALIFSTGKKDGDFTLLDLDEYENSGYPIKNLVTTSTKITTDNSIIYSAPYSTLQFVQGTLPANRNEFTVVGSKPNPIISFLGLVSSIKAKPMFRTYESGVSHEITWDDVWSPTFFHLELNPIVKSRLKQLPTYLYTINSPTLDSINYWLMKKSINLYAEAMLRTIGLEKKGFGSTKNGLEWVDSFYTANGFDTEAMHLYDGSGLSPANRITPAAMCKALYFAKGKSWFPYFYDALPLYNGMKLKSGTINRVKSYAGYHTSKSGREFVVSIMVNNYNSSASALVGKMYKVLDELK